MIRKTLQLFLLVVIVSSCNNKNEIHHYLDFVKEQTSISDLKEFESIDEDSIFHVYTFCNPDFIVGTLVDYPNVTELKQDLKLLYGIDTVIIMREILVMFLHLDLNGHWLSKNNLKKHWKRYSMAWEEQEYADDQRLDKFVIGNYQKLEIGDRIKLVLNVEEEEGSRRITYGNVFDMYHPKITLDDSLVVVGILVKKGPDYSFRVNPDMTYADSSLMLQIEMTEISDTSVSTSFTGVTDDLKIGSLFTINLELYGSKEIFLSPQ